MIKNYNILYKVTTRSRPEKFKALLSNMLKNIANKDNSEIIITADKDDKTMFNEQIVGYVNYIRAKGIAVQIFFGDTLTKVDAINRDVDKATRRWDILINVSDDNEFTRVGFDDVIRQDFEKHSPLLLGCFKYPDGNRTDDLITLAVIGRAFYEKLGYIYNPEYISLYCDNEMTEVAKLMGYYIKFFKPLFLHNHPNYTGEPKDAQYEITESYYQRDYQVFMKRNKLNFNIK